MPDQRLDKLARLLVEYSAEVKPGQLVRLTGDPVAMPMLEALYEAVLKAGAHPYLNCSPQRLTYLKLALGNDEQLQYVNPITRFEVEQIDVSIGIWAETNTRSLSRTDAGKQSLLSASRRPVFTTFMARAAAGELHWCGTAYPTFASAQDAEMSLRQYEEFVFNAGHLDKEDPVAEWRKIEQCQQKVVDFLNDKKEVRFQTPAGTDLTVNVEGVTWINCCGHENFPDGEAFTGPDLAAPDGGANGVVHYSFPAVHNGREVDDIVLTFEKGCVVDAKASKNQDFLIQMLDQDEGARRMGEIALGLNYQVRQYTKSALFDEKIGGTFHTAVGAGYPETGNANESGLHWDMVCDLRIGGTVTADGTVISRDGKFVFDDWPGED